MTTATCTHREATREHLDQCCVDGIDCDRCSQPTGITGPELAAGDTVVLCTNCATEANL